MKQLIGIIILPLLVSCSALTSFDDGGSGNRETVCDDGIDNDGDGHTDCDDQDCRTAENCMLPGEICDNSADDDGDGLVDCSDPDCAIDPACDQTGEICGNLVDDDGDGFVDCEDVECMAMPECGALGEICDNGTDDDGDGLIDCEDPECAETDFCLLNPDCALEEAWWNADDTISTCAQDTACTFLYSQTALSIEPSCAPAGEGVDVFSCDDGTLCSKGAVCVEGQCVFVCDATMQPLCPDSLGNTATCKADGVHPVFSGYSYCVSSESCDPLGGVDSGCREGWTCKVDFDASATTQSDLPTYCVPAMGTLEVDDDCMVGDECGEGLTCSPSTKQCVQTCQYPTQCIGTDTGIVCRKVTMSSGESTYGYCDILY